MTTAPTQWWRHAVVYQIYPRSFADGNSDGVGDLRGIIDRLDYLVALGVDAIWLGPVLVSPQADHGYDVADYRDIDPLFGTLADFDELIAAAHTRGLRIIMDFVPNHTSTAHPWFRAAVAAGPDTPERDRYLFRHGRGVEGVAPPNNWRSVFGGSSWTRVIESDGAPGQWYYHLFDSAQPDLNWRNPEVVAEFTDVLRFWLDRGVDGFRIDVSDALIKDPSFPDTPDGYPVIDKGDASGVHQIYRLFRVVLNEFDGERMAVIETGADPETVALFLRPDEMHLAFNLAFAHCPWEAGAIRCAIDGALAANAAVVAPTTWVTDNHDIPRSVTRYAGDAAAAQHSGTYVPRGQQPAGAGVDLALGRRRHRAMTLLLLALPGTAYLYNGQELGLPNVDDLPDDVLTDPVWERSGHTERGRDGCRIPLPWDGTVPPYGFSGNPDTWLPMPQNWDDLTVAAQQSDSRSMWQFYRRALELRKRHRALGTGRLQWWESYPGLLMFSLTDRDSGTDTEHPEVASLAERTLHNGVVIAVNVTSGTLALPPKCAGWRILLASDPDLDTEDLTRGLPPDTGVWLTENANDIRESASAEVGRATIKPANAYTAEVPSTPPNNPADPKVA